MAFPKHQALSPSPALSTVMEQKPNQPTHQPANEYSIFSSVKHLGGAYKEEKHLQNELCSLQLLKPL